MIMDYNKAMLFCEEILIRNIMFMLVFRNFG